MNCVILQPSYVPWRGYFHQVYLADVFVFYDEVQYDKHGWRNRNRIMTADGPRWLTIPVHAHGNVSEGLPIRDVQIADPRWAAKHWRTITQAYRKAPHFDRFAATIEPHFRDGRYERLADLTIDLTITLAAALGIADTRFVRSSELSVEGSRTERLVAICRHLGATRYISGPAARSYIEPDRFEAAGVELRYMNYNYPPYPQSAERFDPQLSVLDLLFSVGPDAGRYIWGPFPDGVDRPVYS